LFRPGFDLGLELDLLVRNWVANKEFRDEIPSCSSSHAMWMWDH